MKTMYSKKTSSQKAFTLWVILTIFCLLGCKLIGWLSLQGVRNNVFYITPKIPYDHSYFFKPEEVKKFQELLPEALITYEYGTVKDVQGNHQKLGAKVVWVNEAYPEVQAIKLQEGRFLGGNSANIQEVVMSQKLAFQLFKSVNVLGETISFEGKDWEIVGVFTQKEQGEKDKGMLYALLDTGSLEDKLRIPFLYIQIKNKTSLEAKKHIEQLIEEAGKDVTAYQIVDLYHYALEINDKDKVILFCLTLMTLWYILRVVKAYIKSSYHSFKMEIKQCYFWEYLGNHKKEILIFIATISFIFVIIGVSLKIMESFLMSLPIEAANVFEALVVKATLVNELGSKELLPESLYRLWFLNKMGTIFCLIGCVSTFLTPFQAFLCYNK